MGSTRKLLQEIADNQDFERLLAFREAKTWKKFSDEDRELLADLFICLGERELAAGEPNAHRSFETAVKIAPANAQIYLKQGLAYIKGEDSNSYSLACQAFEQATTLKPHCFDSWFHWGIAELRLGMLDQNAESIRRANQHFLKAESLATQNRERAQLYWQWGLCWCAAGKLSGEVYDYHQSLDKFRHAEAAGADEASFWSDYGFVLREVGLLLDRPDVYFQSFAYFVKATKMQPDYREAWVGAALLAQRIFQRNGDRAYFHESDRAFRMLATMAGGVPMGPALWLGWGQLYLDYGKFFRDHEILRLSLERFEKVGESGVDQWTVLSGWAEAQILVGGHWERLDLMQEGMEKCKRCLELAPNHPRLWYLQATGLIEMGVYFNDANHFERAIEGLKHALTMRHNDPVLWYGFAQANYALGDLRRDRSLIARAAQGFSQVAEYGGGGNSQFFNDWGIALMRLAEITHEKKHLEQAIEKFEQAIAFHARNRDGNVAEREGLDPEWLYHYGCALDFLGDYTQDSRCYEKAIQVLSQVIILDANFSHARYNLALAFYHLGELVNDLDCFHKSLELFQSVVEQDSEDEAAWTDWGVTLISFSQLMRDPVRPDISLGLLEQAELKLRQAAALGSTIAYYHLACVYCLSGNPSAAFYYLDRAAEVDSLPPLDEVAHDEWLENLHQTPKFREWMTQISNKLRELQ